MKTMTKRTITLTMCGLLMMLVMYNCKNKDADPLSPDKDLLEALNKIEMGTVVLKNPDAVTKIDGKIELSQKSVTFSDDVTAFGKSGVVSTSMTNSAAEISSALTAAEIKTMSSISAETMAAITAGGEIPANIKAILTKAAANASLAASMPVVTLPTVTGGTVIKGGREGAVGGVSAASSVEAVNGALISDACIALAEAAYQTKKSQLEATRDQQLAGAAASYATAVALIGPAQATCTSTAATKYANLAATAAAQAATLNALLDARQTALGNNYILLKTQVYLNQMAYAASLNNLQAADTQACVSAAQLATSSANAANASNIATIQATFSQAIVVALAARDALAESCHNQGSGN